jgi:NAD(P)-dependent dehydrogenase (short-subunit alcohol dehydrogenase family)
MTRPVLITGCSTGIGLAATTYLAERGVLVYATVRNEDDASRVGAMPNVEAFVCDVTDDAHVARLRRAIDERGQGLWGIVHNAGIAQLGHLTATSVENLKRVFEVNVFGVHRITNAFADLIRASKGRIVTMSSLSGTVAPPLLGAYAMSKHALEAYSDALAAQLGPDGVYVSAIAPGNYRSAIVESAVTRFDAPADAAPEVADLFEGKADRSRSSFPPPDDVAEACYAALFDETPLERYLVVPVQEEADRTLEQAAHEWARLNASTPFGWTLERLFEEVGSDAQA